MAGRYVTAIIAAGAATLIATASTAQQGEGPVAQACSDEMAKLCQDKQHVQGEMRACLEANKDKASSACRAALDTTGPGKGLGANRPK